MPHPDAHGLALAPRTSTIPEYPTNPSRLPTKAPEDGMRAMGMTPPLPARGYPCSPSQPWATLAPACHLSPVPCSCPWGIPAPGSHLPEMLLPNLLHPRPCCYALRAPTLFVSLSPALGRAKGERGDDGRHGGVGTHLLPGRAGDVRSEAEGKVCLEWRMAACGAGREEGGLSVKSTPGGERGAPGPQPPTRAARENGCCLTHATNESGVPREGPDFWVILSLSTPCSDGSRSQKLTAPFCLALR